MAVGSERGTTNLDVLAVDAIFCGGTIVGSTLLPTTNDVTGTFIGSVVRSNILECKGTIGGSHIVGSGYSLGAGVITGTTANVTNANVKGALTGSTVTGTSVSGSSFLGSQADFTQLGVKGTAIGSFIKGTFHGDFLGSSVQTNDMLFYSSGAIAVTTTPATCTHGLGTVPGMILCTPNVISATGQVKIDGANIGSAWFTMTANETGTATAYAIK
jgi:hypothetical protein